MKRDTSNSLAFLHAAVNMAPKAKARKATAPKKTAAADSNKKSDPVKVPEKAAATKALPVSRKRKADAQLDELEFVTHASHGKVR